MIKKVATWRDDRNRNHTLTAPAHVTWQELASQPFIALTGLSSIRRVADAAFVNADTTPNQRCEVEQILSAVVLVESGYGVTALPASARAMFRDRSVVISPLESPSSHRRIGIVALERFHDERNRWGFPWR